MSMGLVADVDSHVTEPADLWTSRLSRKRWGGLVPHVKAGVDGASLVWCTGGEVIGQVPAGGTSGLREAWRAAREFYGSTLDKVDFDAVATGGAGKRANYAPYMGAPAAYDAAARVRWLDEVGITAQVVYPNVAGFGGGMLAAVLDPQLRLECVRAYNEFIEEWCRPYSRRLVPMAIVPYWDPDAAAAEIRRMAPGRFGGIVMPCATESFGLPRLGDPCYDSIWRAASDLKLSVSFHIRSSNRDRENERAQWRSSHSGPLAAYARSAALFSTLNMETIAELLTSGVCHRFPDLRFVSVESGVGWIPFLLEALDWQWMNLGAAQEHPDYDLLPSEYFRRQFLACFWFESTSLASTLVELADNVMFETDFPHPGALVAHPLSVSKPPVEHLRSTMRGIPGDVVEKVLWGNAASLYKLG